MGSISGEFLLSTRRFNCSGHQCSFAIEPVAVNGWLITGHFAAGAFSSSVVATGPVSSLVMMMLPVWSCVAVGRLPAGGAGTPVDDLGLVDEKPVIIDGFQARPRPHRTVDVDRAPAGATDEVVVVVVDPIFVAGRRPRRPGSAHHALFDQRPQGVIHRLPRNRPDASAVHRRRARRQWHVDGPIPPSTPRPPGGDVQPVLPQQPLGVLNHTVIVSNYSGLLSSLRLDPFRRRSAPSTARRCRNAVGRLPGGAELEIPSPICVSRSVPCGQVPEMTDTAVARRRPVGARLPFDLPEVLQHPARAQHPPSLAPCAARESTHPDAGTISEWFRYETEGLIGPVLDERPFGPSPICGPFLGPLKRLPTRVGIEVDTELARCPELRVVDNKYAAASESATRVKASRAVGVDIRGSHQ